MLLQLLILNGDAIFTYELPSADSACTMAPHVYSSGKHMQSGVARSYSGR